MVVREFERYLWDKNDEISGTETYKETCMTVRSAKRLIKLFEETGKLKYLNTLMRDRCYYDTYERNSGIEVSKKYFWVGEERYTVEMHQFKWDVGFFRPWTWHRLFKNYSYKLYLMNSTPIEDCLITTARSGK